MNKEAKEVFDRWHNMWQDNHDGKTICFINRGEWSDPQIAYQGKLLNYWDVLELACPEDYEPDEHEWLCACMDSLFGYTDCGIDEDIDNAEDWADYENDQRSIDEFVYNEGEMYDSYDIPVYAIPRICQLILNPNGELDYYEIPESHAINEYNRYLELNDEDIKNIDDFVAGLNKAMPQGFTIDWDEESVGSPYFEPYLAFGKAMDCVKLRVYPKAETTE